MQLALYRDKNGRIVHQYPFYLLIDPWVNEGSLFANVEAIEQALADAHEDAATDPALAILAARGWRIHYIRSDADVTDDLLPYFAIAEGQLQEVLAARWLQQNFAFSGTEFVAWDRTTTHLYTDGESILCEGHTIHILPEADDPQGLYEQVSAWLDNFAQEVAQELRAPLIQVRRPQA
jgi:hypothetical protein